MKKIVLFIFTLFCVVGAKAQSDPVATNHDDVVIDYAEQMPVFPGGIDSLQKFIIKNVVYPSKAIKEKITGTVRVSFIVEKNGSISNIKVVSKEVGGGLEEEAIRVISTFPKFSPARQNGAPVRIRMTVPIKFKLQ